MLALGYYDVIWNWAKQKKSDYIFRFSKQPQEKMNKCLVYLFAAMFDTNRPNPSIVLNFLTFLLQQLSSAKLFYLTYESAIANTWL